MPPLVYEDPRLIPGLDRLLGKRKRISDVGKNKVGEFIYENNSYGLSVSYYSPSLNNTTYFRVAKFDECSVMALYSVPRTRNIAIDGTCQGQGGRIYRKIYEWKDEYSSWCMVREITGERAPRRVANLP
jgi:hypothetical protein